jgi:Asp-tRNA(Asn)/Glu-tRNA(Gln) amidotransferase A subunit family amidase
LLARQLLPILEPTNKTWGNVMDGASNELVDYLRATAAFRRYPFPDHLQQWSERLLVNRKEMEGFPDVPFLDNVPLQDMPPVTKLELPTDGGRRSPAARTISDPTKATAADIAASVRAGLTSPVEIAEACLARAVELRHLNAFISLDPDNVRKDAQALSDRMRRGGELGPLAGVPVAPKDIMHVAGHLYTCGTKALPAIIADRDAVCVARTRNAGALIFATAHTHELGYGATGINPHFGRAGNPASPAHLAGGSSSGSAVALAANIVPLSIATDTGGSIRIPASVCGVVGFKPTHGLLSRDGVMMVAWSLDDVGPMSTTVADTALLFEVMAGLPAGSTLTREPLRPSDIKLLRPTNDYFAIAHPEVSARVGEVIDRLAGGGAKIVERNIEHMEWAPFAHFMTLFAEASEAHWPKLIAGNAGLGIDIRVRLEIGQFFSAVDYVKAQRIRALLRSSMIAAMEQVDAIITPTMAPLAPEIGSSSNSIQGSAPHSRESAHFSAPYNATGLPAISIPCAIDSRGAPIGLQIAGRPGEDARVLQVAEACEKIIEEMGGPKRRSA